MATRPLEGHPIADAAERAGRDARLSAGLDGDECVDPLPILPFSKQMLHAAQVARTLLADVADEEQVSRGLDRGCMERTRDGQQRGQSGGVVTDAGRFQPGTGPSDGDIRPLRKYRVEVGCDREQRPAVGAPPNAHDVADLIHFDVGQARVAPACPGTPWRV